MNGITVEAENLAAIRAEIAAQTPETQAIVEALAGQLRDAVKRMPILLTAMALVTAEIIAVDAEEGA